MKLKWLAILLMITIFPVSQAPVWAAGVADKWGAFEDVAKLSERAFFKQYGNAPDKNDVQYLALFGYWAFRNKHANYMDWLLQAFSIFEEYPSRWQSELKNQAAFVAVTLCLGDHYANAIHGSDKAKAYNFYKLASEVDRTGLAVTKINELKSKINKRYEQAKRSCKISNFESNSNASLIKDLMSLNCQAKKRELDKRYGLIMNAEINLKNLEKKLEFGEISESDIATSDNNLKTIRGLGCGVMADDHKDRLDRIKLIDKALRYGKSREYAKAVEVVYENNLHQNRYLKQKMECWQAYIDNKVKCQYFAKKLNKFKLESAKEYLKYEEGDTDICAITNSFIPVKKAFKAKSELIKSYYHLKTNCFNINAIKDFDIKLTNYTDNFAKVREYKNKKWFAEWKNYRRNSCWNIKNIVEYANLLSKHEVKAEEVENLIEKKKVINEMMQNCPNTSDGNLMKSIIKQYSDNINKLIEKTCNKCKKSAKVILEKIRDNKYVLIEKTNKIHLCESCSKLRKSDTLCLYNVVVRLYNEKIYKDQDKYREAPKFLETVKENLHKIKDSYPELHNIATSIYEKSRRSYMSTVASGTLSLQSSLPARVGTKKNKNYSSGATNKNFSRVQPKSKTYKNGCTHLKPIIKKLSSLDIVFQDKNSLEEIKFRLNDVLSLNTDNHCKNSQKLIILRNYLKLWLTLEARNSSHITYREFQDLLKNNESIEYCFNKEFAGSSFALASKHLVNVCNVILDYSDDHSDERRKAEEYIATNFAVDEGNAKEIYELLWEIKNNAPGIKPKRNVGHTNESSNDH